MRGMSKENADRLLHRISAAAIANQAILKCSLAGVPLTIDNVIYFVGDFIDPAEEGSDELAMRSNRRSPTFSPPPPI